jgi:predicted transposase/invertase (TIGR01784 family)
MAEHPLKPHDEFFKASFGRLDIARDFIQQMLPEAVVNTLNLDTLELENGSFITPELKPSYSDLVYRCGINGAQKNAWVPFIFEHKSRPDRYLQLQLLGYLVAIWQEQIKQKQPLTPIIPIVVYHGEESWKQRDFSAYFGKKLPQSLVPYIPKFDYLFTNVHAMSDEQILELNKGLLINALLTMKHIWSPQFILDHAGLIFVGLEEQSEGDKNFVISILAYFFKNTEITREKIDHFMNQLPNVLNKKVMSTYEMILEEGRIEGRQEGKEEGREEGREEGYEEAIWKITLQMLRNGYDDTAIQSLLQVDDDFINLVKQQLIQE